VPVGLVEARAQCGKPVADPSTAMAGMFGLEFERAPVPSGEDLLDDGAVGLWQRIERLVQLLVVHRLSPRADRRS
jgi:hypothetical protein